MKTFTQPLVLLILALALPCEAEEEHTAPEPPSTDPEVMTVTSAGCDDEGTYQEGKVLVQVFVSGLSVYNFDPKAHPAVFFPQKNHKVRIGHGKSGDDRPYWSWERKRYTDETFRLASKDPFSRSETVEDWPASGMAEPEDSCAGRDSRWLVNAWMLGGNRDKIVFNRGREAGSWLKLNSATLETCALVFDTNFDGSCMLRTVKPRTKFRGYASEVMVIRWATSVPDSGEVTVLELETEENVWSPKTFSIRELTECTRDRTGCAEWNGDTYGLVVDVALDNMPSTITGKRDDTMNDPPKRTMASSHGAELQAIFGNFHFANWEVMAVETDACKQGGKSCICDGPQPACWTYLRQYADETEGMVLLDYPSNPPICPMVEYP